MRASKLDKFLTIERAGTVVNDYGTPSQGWEEIACTKAQLIQGSTEEFMKSYGSDATRAVVFRIRWRDDIKVTDRVTMRHKSVGDGEVFDIVEIKELGRRDGLELRVLATA